MGTAHFFEHLVFKGSEIKNRQELEMYAENTSTLMNAYTSREQTCYYFQGRGLLNHGSELLATNSQ